MDHVLDMEDAKNMEHSFEDQGLSRTDLVLLERGLGRNVDKTI